MVTRFTGPLAGAWPAVGPGLLLPPGRCLPVPPATDRATWAAGALDAVTLRGLRERAAADLGSTWPVPLAGEFARYFRDGDRDTYERVIRARRDRVSRATVLAAVTLDERWLDEVADGVVLWCEQSTWCWPAHDDTFARHGSVLPTVTEPYLDLGAGEVAAQLAWIDHLLGAQLDERVPGLRERIRYEVERRVLRPFRERRDWHWLGLDGDVHNWNPWIHGNVLVAALQLVQSEESRVALTRLVVEGLDRYVAVLPADGAIDEGYAYWWNGAGRLLEALDLLAYASAGVLGDAPVAALRETVAFPHRVHLGGPWYLNHADSPARPVGEQPWQVLHREARRAGGPAAVAHAAAQRRPGEPVGRESDGLGRLLRALTDPHWLAAAPAGSESWLARDVWFPSTEVLVARRAAGSAAGLTLAVKGGHNGEHHNHNDVGSFVVALGGVPVLVDPGRPTYTAATFGPGRYDLWTMGSSWHNVPEIRGVAQAPGHGCSARSVATSVGDPYSEMSLDLARAYPAAGVRTWRRTARLDRASGAVTVRDQWDLAPGGREPTRIHLILAGAVRTGAGHAVVTALDGAGTLRLSWSPPVPCSTSVRPLDDPLISDVWGDRLTRLEIDVSGLGSNGTLDLTVKEQQR
ncbi:heparinase II/III domain-containing protein [Actinoplanes regularis]|uniref:Heparinase II/III-like protein n=1 Tax=Actinoplanes regularis TaxID=52697 RepID=A0A238W3W9_9ACTN|nr:heparinase II/III family protein [Actinoplanes regularis]GIE85280.1 heparinase [Actinoplanes regularis]SNR41252.1 Heparinase II/III-like protein [Actinoplanes regularis]